MQEEEKTLVLDSFSLAVEKIQTCIGDDKSKTVSNDDDVECLCDCVYIILHHGLKEKGSTSARVASFWPVIERICPRDSIQAIYRLDILQSDQNRCSAWIRQAVTEKTLGSYLTMLSEDGKLLRDFYFRYAFIRDGQKIEAVKVLLLCTIVDLDFDIPMAWRIGSASEQITKRLDGGSDTCVKSGDLNLAAVASSSNAKRKEAKIIEISDTIDAVDDLPASTDTADGNRNSAMRSQSFADIDMQPLSSTMLFTESDQAVLPDQPSTCTLDISDIVAFEGTTQCVTTTDEDRSNIVTTEETDTQDPRDLLSKTYGNAKIVGVDPIVDEVDGDCIDVRSPSPVIAMRSHLSGDSSAQYEKDNMDTSLFSASWGVDSNSPGLQDSKLELSTSEDREYIIRQERNLERNIVGGSERQSSEVGSETESSKEAKKCDEHETCNPSDSTPHLNDDVMPTGDSEQMALRGTGCSIVDSDEVGLVSIDDDPGDFESAHIENIEPIGDSESAKQTLLSYDAIYEDAYESKDRSVCVRHLSSVKMDSVLGFESDQHDPEQNFIPGIHDVETKQHDSPDNETKERSRSTPLSMLGHLIDKASGIRRKSSRGRMFGQHTESDMSGPSVMSPDSSIDTMRGLYFDAGHFVSDSDNDTFENASSGGSFEHSFVAAEKDLAFDIGVNDDVVGLREEHFSTPEGFMCFSTEEELQNAIVVCEKLIKSMKGDSEDKRNLVKKLVQLRMRLFEQKDQPQEPVATSNKRVLGHKFVKQPENDRHVYCDSCGSTVWSVLHTLYTCSECLFHSHKKCLKKIDMACIAEKGIAETYNLMICPEIGLAKQQFRCADCRRRLQFRGGAFDCRLCDYTGRYYCSTCHWNETSIIPARIIHNWDFSWQRVSRQSKHVIMLLSTKPTLNIQQSNPALFNFIEELSDTRVLREQILKMKSYLATCRNAADLHLLLRLKDRQHFVETSVMYSLRDLVDIETGVLVDELMRIQTIFKKHIKMDCMVCQGKGFVCEICHADEVIFPFDTSIKRCPECKATYHTDCFVNQPCPKCERFSRRMTLRTT